MDCIFLLMTQHKSVVFNVDLDSKRVNILVEAICQHYQCTHPLKAVFVFGNYPIAKVHNYYTTIITQFLFKSLLNVKLVNVY